MVPVVDDLAHDVGQRLVDRAGLAPVEEVGVVLDDAVGHLVADDVVGGGEALAVEHADAVPERVRAAGRRPAAANGVAVAHGRRQAPVVALVDPEQPGQVDAADLAVERRDDAGEVEGVVDVRSRCWPDRARCGRSPSCTAGRAGS